jgi:hypothetical protein
MAVPKGVKQFKGVEQASMQGDPHAVAQLAPLVHDELCKLAAQRLAQGKPGQTLEATALAAIPFNWRPWEVGMADSDSIVDRSKIVPLKGSFTPTFLCGVGRSVGLPQPDLNGGLMVSGRLTFPAAFRGEPDGSGTFPGTGAWEISGTWVWTPQPGAPDTFPTTVYTEGGKIRTGSKVLSMPDVWLEHQTGTYFAIPEDYEGGSHSE